MKVIFDTSVWIEYFKGNSAFFEIGQKLLEKGQVLSVEIIFAELLQGALSKREVGLIYQYYQLITPVNPENLLLEAGEYSRKHKLISRGIGIIDATIITATIRSGSQLWTLDKKVLKFLGKEYLFVI